MKNPKITPEMREMAIAILEGEFDAAVALRDAIEECKDRTPITPSKHKIDIDKVRICVFTKRRMGVDELNNLDEVISQWIREPNTNPLFLDENDVSRIEIYEIEGSNIQVNEQIEEVNLDQTTDIRFGGETVIDNLDSIKPRGLPLPITHSDFEFTTQDLKDNELSQEEWLQRRLNTILRT